MKLNQIKLLNEAIMIPPIVLSALKSSAKIAIEMAAVALIKSVLEKMINKFYLSRKSTLPEDLYYIGFGFNTTVPKSDVNNFEHAGGLLRTELEQKMDARFSLYEADDITKILKSRMVTEEEIILSNTYIFGFTYKPDIKELTIKLKKAFGKLNIIIEIQYYGKK